MSVRMRLTATHALVARRLMLGAGALGASALAHGCAVGDMDATPATPVVWLGLLAMLTMLGGRVRWRPRGFGGTLAILAAAQACVHVAMSVAPWAFGSRRTTARRLSVGPAALVAHGAAALVGRSPSVTRLEQVLDRALPRLRAVPALTGAPPAAPAPGPASSLPAGVPRRAGATASSTLARVRRAITVP